MQYNSTELKEHNSKQANTIYKLKLTEYADISQGLGLELEIVEVLQHGAVQLVQQRNCVRACKGKTKKGK